MLVPTKDKTLKREVRKGLLDYIVRKRKQVSLFLCNYYINLKTQFGGDVKYKLPDHQWGKQNGRKQTGTILSQKVKKKQLKAADILD